VDRRTLLIALGFAALAAVLVAIGFRGEERYQNAQAEQAAAPSEALEGGDRPAVSWLKSDTSPRERQVLVLLCLAAASGSYLWILVNAFREDLLWGLAVLFGNWLGAILFTVFVPRQSLLPIFVMTSAYGLSFFAVGPWLPR
jgi:membrane protein insertase Oxa1/YidC/SpoIIIJ